MCVCVYARNVLTFCGLAQDALNRFLEASNPLVSLMLEEVARILRAYRELRDSRLSDVLDALSPQVSSALAAAFGSSSYALGPAQYELRSADLPGARRVLQAATCAMVGSDGRGGEGAAAAAAAVGANGDKGGTAADGGGGGGGCRAALLQEPFEELVRRLAGRIAAGVEVAARSKGEGGAAGAGGGAGRGGGGGGGGFTEWGALLLRKEVRTLQQGLAALMETDSLNTEFDELNELVSAGALRRGANTGLEMQLAPHCCTLLGSGPAYVFNSRGTSVLSVLHVPPKRSGIGGDRYTYIYTYVSFCWYTQ